MRFSRWPSIVLLAYCVCLQFGCSGGGRSQGHSVPPNPVPTQSGLSPNSSNAGCALLTVTASVSGFISTSVIEWKGAALATTYVSSTSLTAQIPASDLTAVSTASVTVVSPAPGGGTSASLTFAANPPSTYVDLLDVEGCDLAWNPIQKQLYGRCRLLRAAMQARSQIKKDLLGGMVVLHHTGTVYQRGAAEKAEKLLYSRYAGTR